MPFNYCTEQKTNVLKNESIFLPISSLRLLLSSHRVVACLNPPSPPSMFFLPTLVPFAAPYLQHPHHPLCAVSPPTHPGLVSDSCTAEWWLWPLADLVWLQPSLLDPGPEGGRAAGLQQPRGARPLQPGGAAGQPTPRALCSVPTRGRGETVCGPHLPWIMHWCICTNLRVPFLHC